VAQGPDRLPGVDERFPGIRAIRVGEHVVHRRRGEPALDPRTPCAQVLVEGGRLGEHLVEGLHITNVPVGQAAALEIVGLLEHVAHVNDVGNVPRTQVLVEFTVVVEHVGLKGRVIR